MDNRQRIGGDEVDHGLGPTLGRRLLTASRCVPDGSTSRFSSLSLQLQNCGGARPKSKSQIRQGIRQPTSLVGSLNLPRKRPRERLDSEGSEVSSSSSSSSSSGEAFSPKNSADNFSHQNGFTVKNFTHPLNSISESLQVSGKVSASISGHGSSKASSGNCSDAMPAKCSSRAEEKSSPSCCGCGTCVSTEEHLPRNLCDKRDDDDSGFSEDGLFSKITKKLSGLELAQSRHASGNDSSLHAASENLKNLKDVKSIKNTSICEQKIPFPQKDWLKEQTCEHHLTYTDKANPKCLYDANTHYNTFNSKINERTKVLNDQYDLRGLKNCVDEVDSGPELENEHKYSKHEQQHLLLDKNHIVDNNDNKLHQYRSDSRCIGELKQPKKEKKKRTPDWPEFRTASSRRETFEKSGRQFPVSVDKMVDSGLFYSGQENKTTCFASSCVLYNFLEYSDPLQEHHKWFPSCYYAKRKVKHPDMFVEYEDVVSVNIVREMEFPEKNIRRAYKILVKKGKRCPNAGELLDVLFNLPEEDDGFEEEEDDWEDEDSEEEEQSDSEEEGEQKIHSLIHADCAEVKANPSKQVKGQHDEKKKPQKEVDIQRLTQIAIENERLKKKLEDMEKVYKCRSCGAKATMCNLPCAHITTCETCVYKNASCVDCKTLIRGVVKVFIL